MHTRFLDHRPPLTALSVIGALVASLFFHGRWLGFLSLTLAFEILALLAVAWRADGRFSIPVSALTLFISLFWAWLALTLLWTPVPATSGLNFWWLGSLPLIYWVSLLTSDAEAYWRFVFSVTGVIAVLLAVVALYQYFHLHALPRSVFLYTNSQDAFLNLVTLPLCAYLLKAVAARRRIRAAALSAAVGLLIFVVALTGERAPAITLIVGFLVLAVVVRSLVPRAALGLPFALAFAAYGLAGITAHSEAVGRLATLAHPAQAAATRVVIWRGAVALLAHAPWHGIGLGLFSLAYPPYRHAGDTSAGFFVHDDYLQIAIEAGWVGLLLFLAVLGSVAVTFVQGLPARGEDDGKRIEMAGLVGALLTVAVHSLVDFNFYIPSILVLSGLILGRLHVLSLRPAARRIGFSLRPALSRGGYRSILMLLALIPLLDFSAVALADHEYRVGLAAAARGDWLASDRALAHAERLFPDSDTVRMTRADLYRHLLLYLPRNAQHERTHVYHLAKHLLRRAAALNPLRPETPWLQGELDAEHPSLTGAHWQRRALACYHRALALDPRFYPARFDIAELLLHQQRPVPALATLTAGLPYWYPAQPKILPYYGLSAALLRAQGHPVEAARVSQRAEAIERAFPDNAMSRKVALLAETPNARGWDVP